MEKIQFRPLGETRTIIEEMDLEITHVHDDLVFIQHNAFLLRFDDECENNLFLHFNEDCDPFGRSKKFWTFNAQIDKFTKSRCKTFAFI